MPLLRAKGRPTFSYSMWVTVFAMIICGFWHGATWTFVCFGIAQGIALVINHIWRKKKIPMPNFVGWVLTIVFFNISLVCFRSSNLSQAVDMYKSMLGMNGFSALKHKHITASSLDLSIFSVLPKVIHFWLPSIIVGRGLLFIFIAITRYRNSIEISDNFTATRKQCFYIYFLFIISILFLNRLSAFIYFQF